MSYFSFNAPNPQIFGYILKTAWCSVSSFLRHFPQCTFILGFLMLSIFCRWVNRARRPIRTSWTSKAWSAPSSSLPGRHSSALAICSIVRLLVNQCSFHHHVLRLQLGHGERRVAGSHRQGHRRLHEEENHLHIEQKSRGGDTNHAAKCLA